MRFGRVAVLAWLAATAGTAEAHHPGSHAVREKDGRVRVEVAAAAADSCTAIASVRNVAPPRVTPPPATAPVTVQLQRSGGAARCTAGPIVLRADWRIEIAEGVRYLHLYILTPDGTVASTERVPLR
jgi:hypothetical protein